jgi:NADH-quinone oxidoreductase subunit J
MEGILFYLFSTLAVLSALVTITRKDPVASAFWLVFCFLTIAALFAMLSAHFMAILQILLYAGAIMVFFIFVTMFLGQGKRQRGSTGWPLMLIALATVVVSGLLMMRAVRGTPRGFPEVAGSYGSIERISELLFTRYFFGFEVTGLLLTAAVIGAVYLARRETPGSRGGRLAPGPREVPVTGRGNGSEPSDGAAGSELVKGASDHA